MQWEARATVFVSAPSGVDRVQTLFSSAKTLLGESKSLLTSTDHKPVEGQYAKTFDLPSESSCRT